MALFKIKKGNSSSLPQTYNEGYCYLTTDEHKFYIDTSDTVEGRICLNAAIADQVSGNLSINGKSYNGSSSVDVGVISAAYGGSGKTNLRDSANAYLNSLSIGSATPADNDYFISQYVGGGTTTTTYHRRPVSVLYSYI